MAASKSPSGPEALFAKLAALDERQGALFDGVQRAEAGLSLARVSHELTRFSLGRALFAAQEARARREVEVRIAAAACHRAAARRWVRPRRRDKAELRLERLLLRLGLRGQAAILLRSGLWRESGQGWLTDLRAAVAYIARGADPAAQSPSLVDQAWYLQTYPDVAQAGSSPLLHYVLQGGWEGRSPTPLFDTDYYSGLHGEELAATGLTPLEHFVNLGVAEGYGPHPLFDIGHYVAQAPELAETGGNPLAHYLSEGWRKGLSTHHLFAPGFYTRGLSGEAAEIPPLLHYLTVGSQAGRRPHPLFDPDWYRRHSPDVAAGDEEPLTHYVLAGGLEGRSPSPWFDIPRYLAQRGEVLTTDPLTDYLQGGAWKVDITAPDFSQLSYFENHPERAVDLITPLERWASLAYSD